MSVQVGAVVLGAGISLIAAKLLKKKNKALVQDDKPTSTATRGSFMPRVIGRNRVGVLFGWVGDRFKSKEGGGKKGSGGKPEKIIWHESGWHILAVGAGKALYNIEQNGEAIHTGRITPESHPSGSIVDLGEEGSFAIYWGEIDQPLNTFLGDAARVPPINITSRWPNCFYIQWIAKRLGEQPTWPLLTYEIEVAPAESHLSNTPALVGATVGSLTGAQHNIVAVVNGAEGTGNFSIQHDVQSKFNQGSRIRLAGNGALGDQDLEIFKMVLRFEEFEFETGFSGTQVGFNAFTDIYPEGGLAGADPDGTLQPYAQSLDDGYNPAHIVADLLFSAWPHGIKRNKADFDMQSLEDFGTLAAAEDLRFSVMAKDGQDLQSLLGEILLDAGVMIPMDPTTGLLKFQPIREAVAPIPNLPEELIVALPEIAVRHGERPVDRLLYVFTDRENFFREMPIGVDDAGQATFQEFFRARKVPIPSTINFNTANIVAERRSQEELAGGFMVKLIATRGARSLLPGTYIVVAGIDELLLIISVQRNPLSGKVTLMCLPDYLGAITSTFVQNQAVVASPSVPVEPDPQFQPLEMPEWLSGPKQVLMLARLRAHAQIDGSAIHISRDNSTFTGKGTDVSIMQGGTLATALAVDSLYELDQGPTITALGPDIASVLDLSADSVSWRRGRQLVAINDELFYLKKVTSLGGDQYRLDGLIRARYHTRVEAHEIGDEVYIIQDDDGLQVEDVLIESQVDLYTKSQAVGRGVVNLAAVSVESIALYGRGLRPSAVDEIRFDTLAGVAGVHQFEWLGAGSTDIPITWGYFTPQGTSKGAGFSGAGVPQGSTSPEGDFLVEILDSGDSLIRSVTVSINAYEYTETDRLADFSAAEPATFKVRVTQLRAGLSSDTTTQTFTRI